MTNFVLTYMTNFVLTGDGGCVGQLFTDINGEF